MKPLRERLDDLDDLENAAWRAWQDAKREGDPLTDDLASIFRSIETLINQYEADQ